MRKSVLITGGASGLGEVLSLEFAKAGYDVIFTYNESVKKANDLKKYIEENYESNVLMYQLDLTDSKKIEEVLNDIYTKVDNISVLVNNAAVEIDKEFDLKTKEDFLYTIDVNLVAPFLISRYVGRKMMESGFGKIINIASNNAIDKYNPITLEYDASKAGLISLTHNLALEFAPNVVVNAVAPGWIATDKIKALDNELDNKFIEEENKRILLNRFASPIDVANLVLFLASEKSNYINSEVIRIDGGSYYDR